MARRHSEGIAIVNPGACNPSGIAHSIIEACAEICGEGKGTDEMRADPALQLMTYQLAFLMGMEPLRFDYSAAVKACEDIVAMPPSWPESLSDPVPVTDAQKRSLFAVFNRKTDFPPQDTWKVFAARATWSGDCIMVPWAGMWLGIEKDGYVHS